MELSLPSKEEIYEVYEEQLKGLKEYDVSCEFTDLAILTGENVGLKWFSYFTKSCDKIGRESRYNAYAEHNGFRGVVISNGSQSLAVEGTFRHSTIRPTLKLSFFQYLALKRTKLYNGIKEVKYGEYPQYAAPLDIQRILENKKDILAKTGRSYNLGKINAEEYCYGNKKYIRMKCNSDWNLNNVKSRLSNGQKYSHNDFIWIEVSPVVWLVNPKTRTLISKNGLLSGIMYTNTRAYDGDFSTTLMYEFLNKHMLVDLFQQPLKRENTNFKISNEIKNAEINELLTEINSLIAPYPESEFKDNIISIVNNLIRTYMEAIKNNKPKMFNKDITLDKDNLDTLKLNLVSELSKIIYRLKANNNYFDLINKLDSLEDILKKNFFIFSNHIKTDFDKVKYIMMISRKYGIFDYEKDLTQLFIDIRNLISKEALSIDYESSSTFESSLDLKLALEIDKLYEKAKRVESIVALFKDENASKLAKDINNIRELIGHLNPENQNKLNEELNSIFNKYYQGLISGQMDDINAAVLNMRREFIPLLERIVIKNDELVDDIYLDTYRNARAALGDNNAKGIKSSIEELIVEINNLIENSNLDYDNKKEISFKLSNIMSGRNNLSLDSKQNSVTKTTNFKDNRFDADMQMLIDLSSLKFEILKFLQDREEYHKYI